jgi:DNA-binding NarL/FixJ family response regulator
MAKKSPPLHSEGASSQSVPLRVLVVDDFAPFRGIVRSILSAAPELIIYEASDGLTAIQQAEALQPDIILLDISLPNMNRLETAERIRQVAPSSKVIFQTQHTSSEMVRAALETGAQGYVVKSHAAQELMAALEAVREGHLFCQRHCAVRPPECPANFLIIVCSHHSSSS